MQLLEQAIARAEKAEAELTQLRAAKCPHVITDREGTSHCSLAERDGQELAKERTKSATLHAALTEADDCLHALSKLYPVPVERIYGEAQERVNAALKLIPT